MLERYLFYFFWWLLLLLIMMIYYNGCTILVYGTRLFFGSNHTCLTATNVYILKGNVLMNSDYLLGCLRDLSSGPFLSLFLQVHQVQVPVQIAWNTIYMLMILSCICIFRSSHLANCLNHMHWNISRSLLVIWKSGLQRIIWIKKKIACDHQQTIERTMRHQTYRHRFGYCHAIR